MYLLVGGLCLGCPTREGVFDFDGDGFPDDIDCAPEDGAIHPDADEVCDDTVDDDCDGHLNDDCDAWDAYEAADPTGTDLGDLTDSTHLVGSFLQGPDDVDRFLFRVDDTYEVGTDDFAIHVEVLLPGSTVNTLLQLELVEDVDGQPGGVLMTVNDVGPGETETLDHQGVSLIDDTGVYAIEVTALEGYDCETAYTLVFDCAG